MVDQHSGIYQETNGTGALMSHRCLPPTLSKMNAITVQNKCRHRTALFDHKHDAVEWVERRADREGNVEIDSNRYLAGPSWRGWTLQVGLRAFDVEIRTRDGRKVNTLPRVYGRCGRTVRNPACLLPALARKPRAWGESPIRGDFPGKLRLRIDAMDSGDRQRTLRLIARASDASGFKAATAAAEHLVEQGHGIDEASLMTLARRIAAGETPYDEPAPDPRRLRPVHATGRRAEGGMMTRPGTAQPDTRRRRASTGQLMDGIMRLARQLPLTRQVLAEQLETATPAQMEFMHAWMNAEIESRERSKRARLLKQGGFPQSKELDGYDWTPLRFPVDYGRQALESLDFVEHTEDVVMFGPPGTGKTHLAIALGRQACRQGIPARFFTAAELVMRILRASTEGRLDRELAQIGKARLLVVDELGYVPIDEEGSRLLFQVVTNAYERQSVIYTTNIEFSGWGRIFGDPNMAAAIIDRTVHHGRMIRFEGDSYRKTHALMQ